jgi:PAS domain S-box-containing protein
MKSITNTSKKKSTSKQNVEDHSFPIVAIGASLGGLEAMTSLLENLPPNTGMAYIYVQHLDPNHKSYLTSILSKLTKMGVQEIDDMEQIAPNNVYVIPYNKIIKVTDGHIKLLPRPKNSSSISIDVLFSSLAITHKENTIGVILSGNGKDGTLGLKAIKDAGGMTFAQDDSAQASSMPDSAIACDIVDFILSPKEIAAQLTVFSKNGFLRHDIESKQKGGLSENSNHDLKTIFEILFKKTGVDFNHYKMSTIKRRLNNKMLQCGVKTIKEYVKLLLKKSSEVDLLYKDLLINVTSFYRDKEAFQYLKTTLFPKLLESKTPDESIRIWVPACSTGEEAYSIAMMLTEMQENRIKKIPFQIFATDLSEQAISTARKAEYSASDIIPVSKKFRERYFTKIGDNYRIVKELREMCVFAPHNILRDPPFSRMDFISCRNLLIYFDSSAQKRVFSTLHFALNNQGSLMLGNAETVGTSSQLFITTSTKFKIYSRKKSTGVRKILELTPHFPRTNFYSKKISTPSKSLSVNLTGIENAIDSAILSRYMPACAVINKDMEILQFRGPISLFLAHPSGKASLNILKMTRPEFAFELRNAIQKVIKTKESVQKTGIEIKVESVFRMMSLEVSLLKIDWDEPLLLIVFTLQEQVEKFIEIGNNGKSNSIHEAQRIKKLTEELNNTRMEINSIIESQETTFEELQAANEEIVSSNEEFQTLNEELETSKEEIETTNEELISINQELQMRNDLLTESHEYSEAIIATIHEPMLVLNKDFIIQSANKSYYKKFLVKNDETERKSFFELGDKQWNIPKLREMLNDILSKSKSFEDYEVSRVFPRIGEKIMLLNAHLILQRGNSEQLILLAISDVSEVRRLALELQEKEFNVVQNEEKEKRAGELVIANKELAFQNAEKEKRANELIIANKELAFQNTEKEKRADELIIANKELAFQNEEKEKRAAELVIANKELAFQNEVKEKRAAELIIANKELAFQNNEKEKRAAELVIANKELLFQTREKEKRAAELVIADIELDYQNKEKEKREIANKELEALSYATKLASQYARSLIEASLDPLVTISAEGKILDVNNASIKVTGVPREKLIGTDFSNYFTEPLMAKEGYKQVFEEGSVSDYPLTIKHKNGKLTDVLYNASVYKDEKGNVLGVFAAARDVTEQKQASLYARSLIEASLDPLVTISAKGEILDVNNASVKVTGVSREKLIGTDFSHYFTEPIMASEGYKQVFEKGSVSDYPLTIKHIDGTLTDVMYNASVYKDEKGNVLGVFAAARDITEQKRIEEYLSKSVKEISDYKFALDEFSIVAITDQKGIIKHANDNFCKVSKYTREELIGQDHRIINSGYHPKEFISSLWSTIANGQIWRGELKNRAKDGTVYWVNTTIVPFLNEQGKPYQYVAVRTDITNQKRIEKELMEAKVFAELATGIAEEAQSKAESATLVAEDAVKAKQQFLSNMSHEIRTPMNAIIGFTKVVLKTDLTAKQKEYLSAIKTSGDALIVLINDILDLAKVDSGKMTFEKTPFKMKASISAMLHLFETKIQEKNLEFVKNYDNKIPEVLVGDPIRLHQIILNLVSNAVKFTTIGKISVSVLLLSEDEDKATIEFSVTDTGIGIHENKILTIFENFQQASSDTSRLFGGTGLGLAIVKQLVEPQGGSITVKSKIGEGSTFSFVLSFQKTEAEAQSEAEILEVDSEIKNIKVLVVEDIALNQLLMKTLLDDFGFERDIASNGKIAIEKLQAKSYDVILMDLQMPEMNGFEATEYIRNTMNSKIPIIALTADVTTVDLAKCKAVGMNDYIAKPIDEKLLYSKIISFVKKPMPLKSKGIDLNENLQLPKIKRTDLKYLIKRTKNNPKLMMEMISLYLEQTPPLIDIMKKSMQDEDWDSVYAAVHKMIPSFSIMGMSIDIENTAKRVQEFSSAKQQTDRIPEMVFQLETVCFDACKELEVELNTIRNLY